MKKYSTLAELIIDYRNFKCLSQLDLAAMVDVDVRTISRWEKGNTLIKPDKERAFAEKLFIPYMIVRHLNSETPIPIYYNFNDRIYALNALGKEITDTSIFKVKLPIDDMKTSHPKSKADFNFINRIISSKGLFPYADEQILKKGISLLPNFNMILFDQSGSYAGCIIFFPMKISSYERIKKREKDEKSINLNDIEHFIENENFVYFYYILYADSIGSTYYLVQQLLTHTKKCDNNCNGVLFAGISCTTNQIKLLTEIGFSKQWNNEKCTLLEAEFKVI